MEESEEIMLVQKAYAGDAQAYEELIRQYARLVWATVYCVMHDATWTEDLVQETFIKGWQMLKTLREPASFRGWLLTIARRIALRHIENQGRQDKLADDLASLSGTQTLAPQRENTEDLRQQLHQALNQLPERYRLPLTLRYLEQLDYQQIAETLGLTDGSLRGLLNRGIKQMRVIMKPQLDSINC
jgi:RNA polymerase sigma-70 factor, ECF subfamily